MNSRPLNHSASVRVKFSVLMFLAPLFILTALAQDSHPWKNKSCAVALTYDDGLQCHLDAVLPVLDSLGLKATFYIPGNAPTLPRRIPEWRAAAYRGHELGNHTFFHPCEGNSYGREWVQPEYNLHSYSLMRMIDEIQAANTLLTAIDGKTKRTFAYPCGDTAAGNRSYVETIQNNFSGARGVEPRMEYIDSVSSFCLGAFVITEQSGSDLIRMVRDAMQNHTAILFLFHGVGGEHSLTVSREAHTALVRFLKQNENEIWTAPVIDIVEYAQSRKQRSQ